MDALPYTDGSPWLAPPEAPRPALEGERRADVVVIGAGYTGLSAALDLARQGARVALLERDFAGAGASGRNAGHLTPTIGKDVPTLLRVSGAERARRLLGFADAAVAFTEETIREHGIDCEYDPSGNVLAGVHPKHEARLRRAAEAARGLGAHVRFLAPAEARERGLPAAFRFGGVLEERGGTLHPGLYVAGLRRAALAAGVDLFEGSPLVALEPGAAVVARTPRGAVAADAAVLATNAYTASTGLLPRRVAPVRVSLFETGPLSPERLAELGWGGREGIYTAHEVLESYRLTRRGTIVGGSKCVRIGWGARLPRGFDPPAFRAIEGAFRERFPTLRDVRVDRFWGGWIGFTPDFLPAVGALDAAGAPSSDPTRARVHYGLGFAGHGVAQATLVGAVLARRALGRRHEAEAALERRPWSWPPEPVRRIAGGLLLAGLRALDRRTDRQVRRRTRRRARTLRPRPPVPGRSADERPMDAARPSRARRLARVPGLGPLGVGLHRLGIAGRVALRGACGAARWWWRSREVTNFTYDLTPRNEEQLAAFLAAVTGAELDRVTALMRELTGDEALRRALRDAARTGPDAAITDAEPRYGRRMGWYVLVRVLRPRVVVETGVDKGLGACVLTAALARNAGEGHPGTYVGIDPNPAAGALLPAPLRRFGRILQGDALERLREIEVVDLFVHDSDHRAAHEDAEYALLEERLSEDAVVLSDNAHVTDCLLRFARRTKRRYLFFAERPRGHWHPGAGIGAAFR